ncbi:RAMP superfamily CRISPR-associated protein [Thermoanaerobacterium sp. CMT5567-10]|uniref:RAMP superfamily CRISPR-associated protein n=1 Tax=Thermoanaerobacterium sp. CMT5567-10 TaxID=3061989 RepID=UPI0026DEC2B4|nr:RAMP superfamily CRISPR-associated protein [Thermoanaerobacterium sp. CMT5567-10]WKV07858.1 RAMP superfamily CRISPR-associated protein [Thermoanaerobacterium sp. CMT5567-10]
MYDNKIERVIFVSGILKLETPCMIGSGNDTNTDIDVVKDKNDIPYIPGSSIAGVLRTFLSDGSKEDDEPEYVKCLFGKRKKDNDESTISPIYFYDMNMINYSNERISIRDGVKLDYKTKTSMENNKYDYEVIESGSCFLFRIEIQLRRKLSYLNDKVENILYKILYSMIDGEIRLGGKTNRGLGKCTIDKNSIKILDLNFNDKEHLEENLIRWFNFDWDCFVGNKNLDEFKHETHINNIKTIKVPLNIDTSIIIRSYNNLENSDQKHITSNGIPVIPGTSWGGAIRSGCYKILKLFYDKLLKLDDYKINNKVNSNINCIFGYVDNESKKAETSKILIEEAKINNGKTLYQTRVKIDRFTGGAAESALFDEEPIYGGETYLTIKVKSEEDWIIGLLILVIKDIQNGFIPIGGEASAGRGIMNGDKIYIDNEVVDSNSERKYLKSLYDFIVGGVSK